MTAHRRLWTPAATTGLQRKGASGDHVETYSAVAWCRVSAAAGRQGDRCEVGWMGRRMRAAEDES